MLMTLLGRAEADLPPEVLFTDSELTMMRVYARMYNLPEHTNLGSAVLTGIRTIIRLKNHEKMTTKVAAAKAAMSEPSARKYLRSEKLPSEMSKHRTHPDAFAVGCEECKERLEKEPDLEAKALFEHLRHKYPGRFRAGQLRTFQWRVRESKEVYFEQVYRPGDRAQSDFTSMNALNITIQGEAFDHLVDSRTDT